MRGRWANSSTGRALPLQGRGHRFEPCFAHLHQRVLPHRQGPLLFMWPVRCPQLTRLRTLLKGVILRPRSAHFQIVGLADREHVVDYRLTVAAGRVRLTPMPEPSAASSRRGKIGILLALLAILLIGGAFRFYNVNWDRDTYHIHPDERHTAMVITAIQWPASLRDYFDTSLSPLNPRNTNMVYFYGTLPLFLTKAVGTLLQRTGYDQIHLVGRVLSGLFDLGSVLLLFFIARRLFNWRVGLVASFLLSLTALNIQGSHYFAVDTFLTFFVALTLWFTLDVADGKGWPSFAALGLAMGLTMACKVSVFLLVVVVALGAGLRVRRRLAEGEFLGPAILRTTLGLILAAVVSLCVFRVAQPYAWAGPGYIDWDTIPAPWAERLRVFEKLPEPLRTVIMPNPRWIADIAEAGAQQTGLADMPWGRQWTERTPWLFPLENMVLWGMGAPLGIAAWLGVAWVIIRGLRATRKRTWQLGSSIASGGGVPLVETSGQPTASRRRSLVLLPLVWVLLVFVWQGTQFVKSVRYFLPIYPFLAMFAALLVVSALDWARGRRRVAKALAGGAAAFVLLGALFWALAFIQIYREPVTRVQASRWIYDHVETGASLVYHAADGGSGALQIPVPSTQIYLDDDQWQVTPFSPPRDLIVSEVVMNNLTGMDGPVEGVFEVGIADNSPDGVSLAVAQIEALFGGEGGRRHVLDIPDVQLSSDQIYYFKSRASVGAPLVSLGSAIAVEHFDDPLPFNIDGRIAYGTGSYRGLELTLYDEDTPEKLEKLLDTLDEADYITMSSGRLWQSIPRLPMRYPVTTRYYDLLFAEELGFEKAAEFHSYPRLFGIEFDDTRAEEQFTVYDHPKVLIYRKTEGYDRARVRTLLSAGIDWGNIAHWLNPKDVPAWRREQARQERMQEHPRDLKLTEDQREVQEQGGTWSSLFDRDSLQNRVPTLAWLVMIGVLGLTTLPLTVAVFHRLPDRGYALARPLGVLLLAWLSWILTNLTPLHYSRGTITLAFGLIALLSLGSLALPGQRSRLLDLWRRERRLIVSVEILFLAFFALFWLIRWGNPDLWHAWKGGEKPMDFAYLNAVIKSTEFPPYDPWFAGGYLNYYYFGQVLVGTLIKWIGILPSVAYNLVIPLWFAMTALGAFSVTYNLVAAMAGIKGVRRGEGTGSGEAPAETGAASDQERRPEQDGVSDAALQHALNPEHRAGSQWRPIAFGVLAALLVCVLGNLGEIHLLLLKLSQGVMETFESTIPGLAALVRLVVGSVGVLFGGQHLPIGLDEWYWNASRAIPAGLYESVITEFPFFTYLYADLHAHLIAMPLTFVSLALALGQVIPAGRAGDAPGRPARAWLQGLLRQAAPLLLWAIVIGAMRTTNTWDVPPHLLVVLGALVIGELSRGGPSAEQRGKRPFRRITWRLVGAVAWKFALVFVLSWSVLYWPFWASYGSYYTSLNSWKGTRTPIWAYLIVHGLFLFVMVTTLIMRVFGRQKSPFSVSSGRRPELLRKIRLTLRYRNRTYRLRRAAQMLHVRGLPVSGWVWTALAAAVLLEVFFLVPGLISATRAQPEGVAAGVHAYRGLGVFALGLPIGVLGLVHLVRPGLSPIERLWSFWVLLGLAMTLGVEVIVIQGDIGRMNTVFKFYLQVWLLWGVTAAAALAWLLPRVRAWSRGRGLWYGILATLLVFAALYPLLATPAKLRDRFDPDLGPGLDGLAYMTTAQYWDPVGDQYDLKWDYGAIRWMLENVTGSPVILEGHTPEYRWGARYSINTGLPTVIGWNWHQRQQRAGVNDQEVWERVADVEMMYTSPAFSVAETLLRKYDVRYVVVGPLERASYGTLGMQKFEQAASEGLLEAVFRNREVTIYETTW